MPPRVSQSAEAARAAAQQAEFNAKKWVWVPDPREGYLAGWVNREGEDTAEVIMAAGGEFREVPFEFLFKMNPPKFDRVEDIADLTFLNEASVVHNLRLRYGSGAIYTYSGLFLVAINPYQNLPLYSDAIIAQYRNKRRDENPPHIFAVAERAWVNMGEERENQSILITGESGAGKTESTKKVISYLAAIATDAHLPQVPSHSQSPTLTTSFAQPSMPSVGLPTRRGSVRRNQSISASVTDSGSRLNAKGRLGLLERQILQANPILEAFGNAQTQRNNNSSRFGKFIRIAFAPDGSISGANIDWYLLEKSRVVVRSEAERSFHVFYQLLVGGGELNAELLLDGGIEDYQFLNKSRREVDGVNDVEEWKMLQAALDTVGFSDSEQFDLFRIVAAILHIGNIVINGTRGDDAVMPDPSQAERVCHLLGIPIAEFTRAILRPRALAGKEWVTHARTKQQTMDELSSLSKTLYEKSFGALVERINLALDRPTSKTTFIGVLDIAGFEIFDINGYEQLLINYTNEKLQQFFNHHMFVLEQEEYTREGIQWDYVNFGLDLQPTIDLIEAPSQDSLLSILSCLDEECIMPKATDSTFTQKLHHAWGPGGLAEDSGHPGRDKYEPTRFEQGFVIQHYAAKVEYRTEGWLEKNKDPLNDNLTRVLAASSEPYVASLFAEYADLPTAPGKVLAAAGKKRTLKKGAFRTVGQRHKEQLASLMSQLRATQPHFVRCIVPNANKKPGRMDVPLVLDQLRCNGVLEGIRIARLGYPNRLPFVEFRQRYEILTPGIIPRGYMDGREACRRMVNTLELDEAIFKIGTSKIFFKAGVLAELEERRDQLLYDLFTRFQAAAHMWSSRRRMKKILNRAIAVRTIQRNARVYGDLRDWPWWRLYTKVRPLLAATRNDEELRKKELELALIKERAERDQKEKEALETLKMELESEKRKVEDQLEAERALALDKDSLIERSKKREGELEEEIAALQTDLDTIDSQLDRAMKLQKETEEKYASLSEAFDQAAEHLVRLETEQKEWEKRESELNDLLGQAQEQLDAANKTNDELRKQGEDAETLAAQRTEDLAITKERTEIAVKELQGKLSVETQNKELFKSKTNELETEARQAKEQLVEMARTANDYSTMIKKKEDQIAQITQELEHSRATNKEAAKELFDVQREIDSLVAQLDEEKSGRVQDAATRNKLQQEVDELRELMEAKTSEETRRNEVEKRKDEELTELRSQVTVFQQELAESRHLALEAQNKLKSELDQSIREHTSLLSSHKSLSEKEMSSRSQLSNFKATIAELEKSKRSLESELQTTKTRQHDYESEIAEATKAKESLERQLAAAHAKYQDFEDVVLELQRNEEAHKKQLETSRRDLETESAKRAKLEQVASSQKVELVKVKDINVKMDRELKKALKDLKDREWEVKQLESKQDKTIVEHVHVLEEAKKVTDRQLEEAKKELASNAAYIRSLEKAKTRLTGEAEDLFRQTEKERLELRHKEKTMKTQEEKAARALAEVEKERRAREQAELQSRRLEIELQSVKQQASELGEELRSAHKSKQNLELELERIAADAETDASLAQFQRDYEARIAQLERQLGEAESARSMSSKLKERIERQHEEIRQLVMQGSNSLDVNFRARLLEELQLADEVLEKELKSRRRKSRSRSRPRSIMAQDSSNNLTPTKPKKPRVSFADMPKASEREVSNLKQQVEVLEIQMVASDRVRQHLENTLKEITTEMENLDGSKQSIDRYRQRLSQENSRLSQLLSEEAKARNASEAAQFTGVQAMWSQFQDTIALERENYARLEESRKALLVQQKTAQGEAETYRAQNRELSQTKAKLQGEIKDLKERLEIAKNEASSAHRALQRSLQEEEVSKSASAHAVSELRAAIEGYKTNEASYQERLETTEIARAKAARADASARRTISELEKSNADLVAARKKAEERLKEKEKRLREAESKLAADGRESSDMALLRKQLEDDLEDERQQHKKDLSERDFTIDQTRKKYQGMFNRCSALDHTLTVATAELAQLSEELQSQRDTISRLREDNRKTRSDLDELQLRYDDEVYNSGGWKKERERLETKISDLNKVYEASNAAQAEQQAQIVSLHSQVRELRSVLDDAEADRALLQKARRALQAELENIKLDHVDSNKMSSESEFQKLQLKERDLKRLLEEQKDRAANALDRMKKAELRANDCQIELGKIRVENVELDKMNASLEKQIKELNVQIVDLETKSYAKSSRASLTPRRSETRRDDASSSTSSRRSKSRDKKSHSGDIERQKLKLEEEVRSYETQVNGLRQALDTLQTEEGNLQTAKRRAEREAAEQKQKALSLERELERLRVRMERPASRVGSALSTVSSSSTIGSPAPRR